MKNKHLSPHERLLLDFSAGWEDECLALDRKIQLVRAEKELQRQCIKPSVKAVEPKKGGIKLSAFSIRLEKQQEIMRKRVKAEAKELRASRRVAKEGKNA